MYFIRPHLLREGGFKRKCISRDTSKFMTFQRLPITFFSLWPRLGVYIASPLSPYPFSRILSLSFPFFLLFVPKNLSPSSLCLPPLNSTVKDLRGFLRFFADESLFKKLPYDLYLVSLCQGLYPPSIFIFFGFYTSFSDFITVFIFTVTSNIWLRSSAV